MYIFNEIYYSYKNVISVWFDIIKRKNDGKKRRRMIENDSKIKREREKKKQQNAKVAFRGRKGKLSRYVNTFGENIATKGKK